MEKVSFYTERLSFHIERLSFYVSLTESLSLPVSGMCARCWSLKNS